MRTKIDFIFGIFFIFVILFSAQFSGEAYIRSSVQGISPGVLSGGFSSSGGQWIPDRTMCEAGQDFIVQIPPFGCEPAVVRSDLLEEQNVPVLCKLAVTQINPLISINAIDSVSFSGKQLPSEISGVGFYPAQAALGIPGNLNSPILNNIGYAVIVLKKQPNSSEMPEMVSGNLIATLRYDIEEAYGIGETRFYLPEIGEPELWEKTKNQYGFWNNKGYLRAESVDLDSARISIETDTKRIGTVSLNKGEISNEIFLPGFDCLVGVKLKLEDLVVPNKVAVLNINGDTFHLNEGEKFLDNKCRILDIEKRGLTNKVKINCRDDDKSQTFELVLSPKVSLNISGEVGSYDIGEYLYSGKDEKGNNVYVYLGYIGTKEDTGRLEDLYVTLVSLPVNVGNRLSEENIAYYSSHSERLYSNIYKEQRGFVKVLAQAGAFINVNVLGNFWKLFEDKTTRVIPYNKESFFGKSFLDKYGKDLEEKNINTFSGKKVEILGFATPVNFDLNAQGTALGYYRYAFQDYSRVITSYAAEKDSTAISQENEPALGQKAFAENILLAFELKQMDDVKKLCEEFKVAYKDSKNKGVGNDAGNYEEAMKKCENPSILSSATSSSKSLTIDYKSIILSLEAVKEPSFEDFGAEIKVTYPGGNVEFFNLEKDKPVYLKSGDPENKDYLQLKSINEETISMYLNRPKEGSLEEKLKELYETPLVNLKKGDMGSFGTAYSFEIIKINEKRQAKVSVIPTVNRVATEANFSFYIGIEQRSIKLSPEKTKQMIEGLNKSIKDWEDINKKLTSVVEGMKGACLATGLALTVKNFLNNLDGQSIARQQVMIGEGGWNKRCADMISDKKINSRTGEPYKTLEECIFDNEKEINKDVELAHELIKKHNSDMEPLNDACKLPGKGFFFEDIIDTSCLQKEYSKIAYAELSGMSHLKGTKFKVGNEEKNYSKVLELINTNQVSVEQMREILFYARSKEQGFSDETAAAYTKKMDSIFANIYASNEEKIAREEAAKEENVDAKYITPIDLVENKIVVGYEGLQIKDLGKAWKENKAFSYGKETNSPVQFFIGDRGVRYLGILKKQGDSYYIDKLYYADNKEVVKDDNAELNEIQNRVRLVVQNPESYKGNTYKSSFGTKEPVLKCYEHEPYKGYPAIIPVDTVSGWYVKVSQTLPVTGGIASYQDSGRVMSFSMCNVWENGMEENGGGDDKCTGVNLGTGQSLTLPGLSLDEANKLVNQAVEAVRKAQAACQNGKAGNRFDLAPNAKRILMGSPAVDVPEMSCSNFMSPSDCKILFNVCDPVICPNSRCDFGGKYPVDDVIQSGVIGSIFLCLPNFIGTGGDVYIPVCLSGVKAGLDGYLSILGAYRGCLQENLDSGRMVGICDEIYSIHLCEFFWRQTLPLANMIIPKTIEYFMGKSVRGGGEYLGVQDAWTNAGQSVSYFAQYYSAEAYASFKGRVIQGVSDEVCKTYISGAYPEGGKILDSLTEATSPPQYHGRFDEIPFTTATSPPISHYKVYYHIYAGENSRAYYQIYLADAPEGSYYQETSQKLVVDTGYIEQGGRVDETKDFTGVSGYKQMCIVVNGNEDCGFKQVSSSFAVDWVADQYVKEQASENVTSEKDCYAGTPSAWSLASLSLEGAADEMINPALYNRGIIRICSHDNPGSATDVDATNPRWVPVGYCGETSFRCWLDKESVKNAVNFQSSTDEVLETATENFLEQMKKEGKFLSEEKFKEEVEQIKGESSFDKKIIKINDIIDRVSMNAEKGLLYLLRGGAYGELANIEKKDEEDAVAAKKAKDQNEKEEEAEGEGTFTFSAHGEISKTLTPCQKEFADKIIEIAREIKTQRIEDSPFLSDDAIKKDTGAENFGNLVLAIAFQESSLNHFNFMPSSQNCFADDGNRDKIITGDKEDSIGIMQINLPAHPSMINDAYLFEKNVKYAAELLIRNYHSTSKNYACTNNGKGATYSGWQRAIRMYNGWNTDCSKGNANYVEEVLSKISYSSGDLKRLVDERVSAEDSPTGSDQDKLITGRVINPKDGKVIQVQIECPSCFSIKYYFWYKALGILNIPTFLDASGEIKEKDTQNIFSQEVSLTKLDSSKEYYLRIWGYDKNNNKISKEFDVGPFRVPPPREETSSQNSNVEGIGFKKLSFSFDASKKHFLLEIETEKCQLQEYKLKENLFLLPDMVVSIRSFSAKNQFSFKKALYTNEADYPSQSQQEEDFPFEAYFGFVQGRTYYIEVSCYGENRKFYTKESTPVKYP